MKSVKDIPDINANAENIIIIGLVTHLNFQRAKTFAEKFTKSWPGRFPKLDIFPLYRFEWDEHILKLQRLFGADYYKVKVPVLVYINDKYIGNDDDFIKYLSQKYRINLYREYHLQGIQHFKDLIRSNEHKFVRLMLIKDDVSVGELVFELFTDVLPITCENFLRLCSLRKRGYKGSPIHRICKSGWVQMGGYRLEHQKIPCEGYQFPHNRRGILSMCNHGKHRRNSTQFFITLNPQSWMDYYYVAFGQMIDGNQTLSMIENMPTYFESPLSKLFITNSITYEFEQKIEPIDESYFEMNLCRCADNDDWSGSSVSTVYGPLPDVIDDHDCPSILTEEKFKAGDYCFETDLVSHIDHVLYPLKVDKEAVQLSAPPPSETSDDSSSEKQWSCACVCVCSACNSKSIDSSNATYSDKSNISPTSLRSYQHEVGFQNIFDHCSHRTRKGSIPSFENDLLKCQESFKSCKTIEIKHDDKNKSSEIVKRNSSTLVQKQNIVDNLSVKSDNTSKENQNDLFDMEDKTSSHDISEIHSDGPIIISEQSYEILKAEDSSLENLL